MSQTAMGGRKIRKVAILGSGVMGSRIACHFANIGCEVVLLDIVPFSLNAKEESKGLTLENPQVRNRLVNDFLQGAIKSRPAPLYDKKFANRISTGNFDDNMDMISDCDLILEAVIERLDIKKSLYEKVEKFRKEGTIMTSNTSGIPMHLLIDGRSEDFQKNFCGMHFFNPPRYLRLLEIIPAPTTDPAIVEFLMDYGHKYLGKETVLCKDTPAFIANRIGVYAIISAMHTVDEMKLTVAEVDKLTGPVIGRAKSATFRTMDLVGLDTTINVSNNLHGILKDDESRDKFKLPKMVQELEKRKWFGDKTKQGFYKKTKTPEGKREILELNLETFEYAPKSRPSFDILKKTKSVDSLKKRLPMLINSEGKAGEFYRACFYDLFRYVTFRIPEIADELYRIDNAVCAGFAWELGVFATWDVLGVAETVKKMEEAGQKPAQWVYDMLDAGNTSFYKSEGGLSKYYDIPSKSYKVIPGTESLIALENLRETNVLWKNAGSSIFDLGDGIICLEFHSKMNTLGVEVIEGLATAINMAEKDYRGLVIGNEGPNFSVGANLMMLFMYAQQGEFDEVNHMIANFQRSIMRVRYSSIPVVGAPAGMALGGGCEMLMHCDAIQAHAESYIGLVEVGAGLIPAGAGTKELAMRAADAYVAGDIELNRLQEYFLNIAMAKVATSAEEAKIMGILRPTDSITMNRSRLLSDAKAKAIAMADAGYTQPIERKDVKVLGKGALAPFMAGVHGFLKGGYISEHDSKIAQKLAYVICGGDLDAPAKVSEQYLLNLEREAFLALTQERKTMERIQSLLIKNRPLRN
jgi:3-hydroxyacyl-CoA dehydrogenase